MICTLMSNLRKTLCLSISNTYIATLAGKMSCCNEIHNFSWKKFHSKIWVWVVQPRWNNAGDRNVLPSSGSTTICKIQSSDSVSLRNVSKIVQSLIKIRAVNIEFYKGIWTTVRGFADIVPNARTFNAEVFSFFRWKVEIEPIRSWWSTAKWRCKTKTWR